MNLNRAFKTYANTYRIVTGIGLFAGMYTLYDQCDDYCSYASIYRKLGDDASFQFLLDLQLSGLVLGIGVAILREAIEEVMDCCKNHINENHSAIKPKI